MSGNDERPRPPRDPIRIPKLKIAGFWIYLGFALVVTTAMLYGPMQPIGGPLIEEEPTEPIHTLVKVIVFEHGDEGQFSYISCIVELYDSDGHLENVGYTSETHPAEFPCIFGDTYTIKADVFNNGTWYTRGFVAQESPHYVVVDVFV